GGKTLEYPDWVVGREHRYRRAEPDPLGASGDDRQNYFRGRHRKVRPVVLADAEGIDVHFIGEDALIHDVADHLRVGQDLAVRPDRDISEGIKSKFEFLCHLRALAGLLPPA